MNLQHESIESLKKDIKSILCKYLDISKYKVFFYGSRVVGKNTDYSDIDLGIEGENPIPFEIFARIQEEVEELPTLYTIDIVDFGRLDSKFIRVAKQNIEQIIP